MRNIFLMIYFISVPRKVIQLKYVSKLQDDESPDYNITTTTASVTNTTQDYETKTYNITERIMTTVSQEKVKGRLFNLLTD